MTHETLMETRDLRLLRGGRAVLGGVTLRIGRGECVGLIGPNGAGKTTFLRAAMGLIPATGYSSLAVLSPILRARAAAYLPQKREIAWPLPVETVVALGRMARPGEPGAEDRAAVDRALSRLDLAALRRRPATELSGGEQARVLLARALAQEAPLLIADEPTAGMDPAAQIGVMDLFRSLAGEGGCVLAALHDLGLAARHCTRLVAMREGRIVADGAPRDVLTPGFLAQTFGIRAHLEDGPDGIVFQPLGRIG